MIRQFVRSGEARGLPARVLPRSQLRPDGMRDPFTEIQWEGFSLLLGRLSIRSQPGYRLQAIFLLPGESRTFSGQEGPFFKNRFSTGLLGESVRALVKSIRAFLSKAGFLCSQSAKPVWVSEQVFRLAPYPEGSEIGGHLEANRAAFGPSLTDYQNALAALVEMMERDNQDPGLYAGPEE